MAKKLNAFEIKLMLEYRQYQDIKNLADKKCKQLQKQVYQLIDDKKVQVIGNFNRKRANIHKIKNQDVYKIKILNHG